MSEFYKALQKLEEQKKKENANQAQAKAEPAASAAPDQSKEGRSKKTEPAAAPEAPAAKKQQEKTPAARSPQGNKPVFVLICLAIVGILGLNAAIFMQLNKYAAGRSALAQQMGNIETLLTGNEQKIDGLAVEIRRSKLDTEEVTRVLNDISGRLAGMERQANANTAEVNALNREKSRMTERLSKIERELSAMAEQLKAASATIAEAK